MYFIKTKGTNKVLDFVQIRDDNFVLIKQLKLKSIEKNIAKLFKNNSNEIVKKIQETDFDIITHIKTEE